MKKRRLYLLLTLLIVASMLFTACSPADEPEEPAEEPGEEEPAEEPAEEPSEEESEFTYNGRPIAEEIVIGRIQDSNDLDPVTQDGNVNIWMFNLMMEGLVKTSDDGTEILPALAEDWEISDDKLTYTFNLVPDVKFSNGDPVLAEDWVWSIERARDTEASVWKFAAEGIADVEAPDDETVVITLGAPRAAILAELAMFNLTVQDKSYYEEVGQEEYSQMPVGTGPYRLVEWRKGEDMTFEKNPYYRGEAITERIKFVVVPDDNTRALQLESGQIDAMTYVPFNRMDSLDENPDLKAIGIPSTETRYVVFNNGVEPFDDLNVRLAMQYGTDKQEMVDFVLYGYGQIATSYAPPAGLYYNDSLEDYGYDVEKAKELLADAGYPDGFETELLVRAGNAVYEQMAVILKEQWAKIGVTANILSLESATAVDKYRALEHEVTLSGWTNDIPDPSQQVQYVFMHDVVSNYYTDWKSERAEELVEQGIVELDEEKREDIYLELQEIHFSEVPMMPVFHSVYPVAMKNEIEGFNQTPLGNYRFEELVMYMD